MCMWKCLIMCASPGGGGGVTNLCPDESLKAWLEVVDAAVVELGHLIEQLLVLDLKVFLDWSELLSGLECGGKRRNKTMAIISSHMLQYCKNNGYSDLEMKTL